MSIAEAASCTAEISTEIYSGSECLFSDQDVALRADRCWWVFYTKSRQEKALARHLVSKRVPHYLPLQQKTTLWRGRRLCSLVPLFSGYVFLFVDAEERVAALASNRVARTIAVPASGQQQLEGDLLQIHRLIESGVPLCPESRIEPGQLVRIKSGRLAGLEGVVTKRRAETRLLVAVNYMQQGASIEVDDFVLEAI